MLKCFFQVWKKRFDVFLGSFGFKKVNLVFMTKATKDNDKSISTNIVAVTFDNELGSEKVSEERVWKSLGYFDAGKSDYSMEKINFPDNTLLYINQAFLTVKMNKKIYYCDYYVLDQILEASGYFLLHPERWWGQNGSTLLWFRNRWIWQFVWDRWFSCCMRVPWRSSF